MDREQHKKRRPGKGRRQSKQSSCPGLPHAPNMLRANKTPAQRAYRRISFPNTGGIAVSNDTLSPNVHRFTVPLGQLGRRWNMRLYKYYR